MAKFDRKLATILGRVGLLTDEQRDQALAQAEKDSVSFCQVLIDQKIVKETDIIGAVASEMNLPPIDLNKITCSRDALDRLDEARANTYQVLPVAQVGKKLTLAMANPSDVLVLDDLHVVTGCDILPVVSTDVAIRKAIQKAYQAQAKEVEGIFDEASQNLEITSGPDDKKEDEVVDLAQVNSEDSPLVKMVNLLILQAIQQGASDIHVEPYEKRLRVRYRIDGSCHETVSPPKGLHAAISVRIKIMAGLDIAETRKPQDGKFQMLVRGRQVDFRIACLPMVHGEKITIRILDAANLALSLDTLGFEPEALSDFRWATAQPYGMILATGPTGCGKSTTLYSAVREVMRIEDNITTVEDPVEYQLDGVNQVPVCDRRGLTFAASLRAILRQDPDTVMIGEMRDKETAEIAVKAALTGHLVLSTLHTNDAPSTIMRLVDMGIDRFLVASSVVLVAGQRLMRKLCAHCKEPYEPPRERLLKIGAKEEEIETGTWYRPKGCQHCSGGYKGRFAILETLRMTESIRRCVVDGGSILDIRAKALEDKMLTLRRSALRNAARGKTSIEEVLSGTLDDV